MIVHPAFALLGLSGGLSAFLLPARQAPLDLGVAAIAVALYFALAAIALLIGVLLSAL